MRQLVHNVSIRVFEKDYNNLENIQNIFNRLLPVDFKKEKVDIDHEEAEGFEEKTIHILSMETEKRRHNRLLLRNLFQQMHDKDKSRVFDQRRTRVDDEGNFYIRLDKQSLLDQKYVLTEGGDCFHFRIKIAAYPKNEDTIMDSIETLLSEHGCTSQNPT
ncbi:MAG: RNA-binding domain-containing protein [Candidatus Thermoplasmatota archaeon]